MRRNLPIGVRQRRHHDRLDPYPRDSDDQPSPKTVLIANLKVSVGNGRPARAQSLPASWPRDVPVLVGKILGSTASAGRWTVLILEAGPAATVHQSATSFYIAAGFKAVSASVLNKGNRRITLVVRNRDDSATMTNLVIQLTTP